jgi:hypothetical protein
MTLTASFDRTSEPAVETTDQLYHSVRRSDGGWLGMTGLLERGLDDGPSGFVGASATGLGDALELVAAGTDGELYHATRWPDSSWEPFTALRGAGRLRPRPTAPFERIIGSVHGGPPQFYGAACAHARGLLHVVGLGCDGHLCHTVRWPNGCWQHRFERVPAIDDGQATVAAVACAGDRDALHLAALDSDGQLHYAIRDGEGQWQDFERLGRDRLYDAPPRFAAIDCATVRGCLQIIGVGSDGRLYHTLRWPDGTWQRYFGVLGGQEYGGAPRFALGVGCARVGLALEVVAIGADGRLQHATRRPDGSWRESHFGGASGSPGGKRLLDGSEQTQHGEQRLLIGGEQPHSGEQQLADVSAQLLRGSGLGDGGQLRRGGEQLPDEPPPFYAVSCASAGQELHVIAGTWQGGFA